VATSLSPDQVRERLALASRRGRLPGYAPEMTNGDVFRVSAFGHPFDGVVIADAVVGDSTRLRFRWRLAMRPIVVFAVALVLTVWPGSYFMDQAMIQFFPGLREAVETWKWYIPLSIVSGAWAWVAVLRRTRRTVSESAHQLVGRIATEVDGSIE
jgi:hypothetical protein